MMKKSGNLKAHRAKCDAISYLTVRAKYDTIITQRYEFSGNAKKIQSPRSQIKGQTETWKEYGENGARPV